MTKDLVSQSSDVQVRLEKENLIRRICILRSRRDALDNLINEDKKRLELLMSGDAQDKMIVEEGTARNQNRRRYFVNDPEKLAALIPAVELARGFRPDKAFVEGATKAKIDVLESAIGYADTSQFIVERARTKAARELTQQIIEETQQAASDKADEVARRLLNGPVNKE